MEPLFTPWRMPYIQSIKSGGGCIFCDEVLAGKDPLDLIVHRGRHAFVVLNLYPYSVGHLMIVPYRHLGNLEDVSGEEMAEISGLLARAERTLGREPEGRRQTIGMNVGRCAGAGVEGHLHIHLVPLDERGGSVSGRELFEPLPATHERLARGFRQDGSEAPHSSNS
jgi:ATP adenylyltransferase